MKELKLHTAPILRTLVALAVVLIFILPGRAAGESDPSISGFSVEESEGDSLQTVPDGFSTARDSTTRCSGECLRLMPTPPPGEWIIEEEDPEEVPKLPETP